MQGDQADPWQVRRSKVCTRGFDVGFHGYNDISVRLNEDIRTLNSMEEMKLL